MAPHACDPDLGQLASGRSCVCHCSQFVLPVLQGGRPWNETDYADPLRSAVRADAHAGVPRIHERELVLGDPPDLRSGELEQRDEDLIACPDPDRPRAIAHEVEPLIADQQPSPFEGKVIRAVEWHRGRTFGVEAVKSHTRLLCPERERERIERVEEVIGTVCREISVYDVGRPLGRDLVQRPRGQDALVGIVHRNLKACVRRDEEAGRLGGIPRPERFLEHRAATHLGTKPFGYLTSEVVYAARMFPGGGHLHHSCLAVPARCTSGR